MPDGFELTAAAGEDPRLGERLRAEPPDARAALLAQADALAAGSEEQRRLAASVYRELHADIDPTQPDGARRTLWFLDHAACLEPESACLVRRAAAHAADPEARLRATVLAARHAEGAGDLAGAEQLLVAAIESTRGTGSEVEVQALHHAALVAANHEDCVRALAYSARALRLRRGRLRALDALHLRRCRADALAAMRDAVRFEREIGAAESFVGRLDARVARRERADNALSRAAALLRRGLPERAIPHLEEATGSRDTVFPSSRVRTFHALCGTALLDLGKVDAAAAHVARGLRTTPAADVADFELDLLRVRLQHAAGGPGSAAAGATALVERLGREGRRVVGPSRRARLALAAAAILRQQGGDTTAARRAFDLAATSVVESIARIDLEAARGPELSELDPDDLAALRGHHERETATHAELERTVARFLEESVRNGGPAFLAALAPGDAKLAACAWCGRIRGSDGHWLPIAHFLPSEDTIDLTHGACETCTVLLRQEAAESSEIR